MTDIARLQTVDAVDATILVNNSIDILMASTDRALRPPLTWDWSRRPQLIAEHGYSLFFNVHKKGSVKTILYDADLSPDTITHNLSVLGIQPTDLDAIVLSPSHADHHGGLLGLVRSLGKRNLPLVLHPMRGKTGRSDFHPDRKCICRRRTVEHSRRTMSR